MRPNSATLHLRADFKLELEKLQIIQTLFMYPRDFIPHALAGTMLAINSLSQA